jgi:NAD+ synthase
MTNREACVNWIKDYFANNKDGKAIIGISGGKDSTIAAALCVEALGADRVIGVKMPQGRQTDIDDSREVCEYLGIHHMEINIGPICNGLCSLIDMEYDFDKCCINNPMVKTNLPARLRMATLYAVAALYPNSRVVNTCNRSEDYVGYSTKYGDAAGDFSPLGNLTVREVLEIGDELGLPSHLVHKAPSDGMCGKTDEDNLGFTYEELDNYILGTDIVSSETIEKIEKLHNATRHKYTPMPTFTPAAGGIVDPDQLVLFDGSFTMTFDNSKQYKRGLRAESGTVVDDYADGGLVDSSLTASASAMADPAKTIDIHVAEPAAAVNVEPNLGDVIESIEKAMWKSIISNEIRGNK